MLYAPGAVDTGASLLLRQSDMNHHPKLLLLCVRGLSTYNPDKVSIDEHVTMLLKSGECAVSIIRVCYSLVLGHRLTSLCGRTANGSDCPTVRRVLRS